ncbi:HD-GYP domain-containing protein [Aliikangiella sp. IMCC44653]
MSVELDEVKISVDELELGMFVSRLDRPWEETSFLLQGFLIQTPEDLEALIEQCEFVFIETKQSLHFNRIPAHERRQTKQGLSGRKVKHRASAKSPENAKSKAYKLPAEDKKIHYINKIPVEKEFTVAKQSFKSARQSAKNIMDGLRIGRALDMNECRETVNSVVSSILRNSNALMWLSHIKNKDDYTAEHSLNVCILSVAFARHLGLSEHDIEKVGLCGLLHDVGKAKIPLEILNKPGRFTDEEFDIMRQHTTFGKELLMSVKDVEHAAIDVALSHHERIDSSGYPRGLVEQQIPLFAKIISITDTYDAITSSRCYDKGRSSMVALDIIYKNKGTQFDENLAIEFIKCIGIYPPGCIVEMTNGEVGIIIASNKDSKLKPRMILVLNADKTKRREKVIDLRDSPCDDDETPYKILCEHPNGTFGVNLKAYLDRGLVIER